MPVRVFTAVAVAATLSWMTLAEPPRTEGPVRDVDPETNELVFTVTIAPYNFLGEDPEIRARREFDLRNTPIVMPVIKEGASSLVDMTTIDGNVWLDGTPDPNARANARVEEGKLPMNTALVTMPIERFRGREVRWQIRYVARTWSTQIDENALQQISWPREWPEDVRPALEPQFLVESNDPLFKQAVENVSKGQLRFVPPYLAAKDLVRYCIDNVRINGDGVNMGLNFRLHGFDVVGAARAAKAQEGGPHDLVCVCVAMLRAAGIPARVVIGATDKISRRKAGEDTAFVTWGEFYLPDAGWIPFDPVEMRGSGVSRMDVKRQWPHFGQMKDLNERIPLAYHFIPPVAVTSPRNPAVWGWAPQPRSIATADQFIQMNLVSVPTTNRGTGGGYGR